MFNEFKIYKAGEYLKEMWFGILVILLEIFLIKISKLYQF